MKLSFNSRRLLAPGIWQHEFTAVRPVDFVPGQYADITLMDTFDDPRGRTRTFTLTSQPGSSVISFITKDFDPVSPYKQALHAMQPGDDAMMTDAMGDMVLPMSTATPLVFVASGIAIASYVSMLQSLAGQSQRPDISVLYAVRYPNQIIYKDLWKQPAVRYSRTFIGPQRLTARDVLQAAASDSLIYLSGSEHFVEDIRNQLLGQGVAQHRIVFDFYDGYAEQQI